MIPLVYIASKYSAETSGERLRNTHISIDAADELYQKSGRKIVPYPPLWTHYMDERRDYLGKSKMENEEWYAYDNAIIPKCDAMIKLTAHGVSHGADEEEKLAIKLGIPVYYSIDECIGAML